MAHQHISQLTQHDDEENTLRLIKAATQGSVNDVKELIPVSDPKSQKSWALRCAAERGNLEIVRLLLPVSDLEDVCSGALRRSAANGHTDIVRLLVSVLDRSVQHNNHYALKWAAINGHAECVKLLLPISDYKTVLKDMDLKVYKNLCFLQKNVDEYEILQQKERLNNTLDETVDAKKNVVKRKI